MIIYDLSRMCDLHTRAVAAAAEDGDDFSPLADWTVLCSESIIYE